MAKKPAKKSIKGKEKAKSAKEKAKSSSDVPTESLTL